MPKPPNYALSSAIYAPNDPQSPKNARSCMQQDLKQARRIYYVTCHFDQRLIILRVPILLIPHFGMFGVIMFSSFLHDNAILIVLPRLFVPARCFLHLTVSRCFHIHRCAAACCRADGCQSMFCALIASVSGFDVPDVGFEDVSPCADAHLGEVANGVLGFCEAYMLLGKIRHKRA